MGEEKLPTYFVRNASRLLSEKEILHYNLHERQEVVAKDWLPESARSIVGITAGASCPKCNLIEETLVRLYELRGISREQLEEASVKYRVRLCQAPIRWTRR